MKKVLIIGAGFLQDFVICKANSMGYETYAVDADPDAVGFKHAHHHSVIDIVDEKACLKYAMENCVDGVLAAATDYGVLTAAYVSQKMSLPGLKYKVAQLIKNKYEVRRCLCEHHVDDTEQTYEINRNTDVGYLTQILSYPVMVKPCDGSGSRGASRVDEKNKLAQACELAMASSITDRAVIEPFIEGKEYGAESLVVNGKIHVLGIMQKWMTDPPYYAELGHSIPNNLKPAVEKKVKKYVASAIKTLGINFGSVNMDILITADEKVYIVDIGARMGGNMIGPCVIPYGTGIDYMAAMLQNAVGDDVDLGRKEHTAVVTRLLAFKNGVIRNLPDVKQIERHFGVEIYHHMELGMRINEYHTNLDGCGYIVSRAKTQEKAIEKAENALNYFRNTIF